jgi:hypothetical protein
MERSGLTETELIGGGRWDVQAFRRYLPDREPEIAVILPRSLVTAPTLPVEEYDVRLPTQGEGGAEDRAHDADAKTHDGVRGHHGKHERQEEGEQDQSHDAALS